MAAMTIPTDADSDSPARAMHTMATPPESDGAANHGERCDPLVEEEACDSDRHQRRGSDDDARRAGRHVQLALVEQQLIRGHPEESTREDPAEITRLRNAHPTSGGDHEQCDGGDGQANESNPITPRSGAATRIAETHCPESDDAKPREQGRVDPTWKRIGQAKHQHK